MIFSARITVSTYKGSAFLESTEVFNATFDAPDVQTAETHLSHVADTRILFSGTPEWEDTERHYTGKDVRWTPWSEVVSYTDEEGTRIHYRQKVSQRENCGTEPSERPPFTRTTYRGVSLVLEWRQK